MNEKLISQLKKARLKKGWTQAEVAKRTGLKNTTISNYENGISEPDIDTFLLLFRLYELDFVSVINDAYGIDFSDHSFVITPEEIEILLKFRELDEKGKELIVERIKHEYDQSQTLKRLTAYYNAFKNTPKEK